MEYSNLSYESTIGFNTFQTKKGYFVIVTYENLNERLNQLQEQARKLLKLKAKVISISAHKVLSSHETLPNCCYVIPEFEAKLYEHLRTIGARIYGPLAILQAIDDIGKIPVPPHPLLALHLAGYNITVTGLNQNERTVIYDKIRKLGGIASGSMTDKVTHLIARSCDPSSQKYNFAVRTNTPVVLPEWIEFVNDSARNGSILEDTFVNDFIVPIFAGCQFSASGFDGNTISEINRIVLENGGVFSVNMNSNESTHLIIDSNTGEKYRKALLWGTVKIVTMRWLIKCCEIGLRLPEEKYFPGIKSVSHIVDDETFNDSLVSSFSTSSRLQHGSSTTTSTISCSAAIPPSCKAATSNTLNISQTNHSSFNSSKRSFNRINSIQAPTKISDPVLDFDMSLFEDGRCNFLDDCRLHFFELSDNQQRPYRRLANCTGCSIADKLNAGETHIIVPPGCYSDSKLKLLMDAIESGVEVVRCEWLIGCVKHQRKLDTTDYFHPFLLDQVNSEAIRKKRKIDSDIDPGALELNGREKREYSNIEKVRNNKNEHYFEVETEKESENLTFVPNYEAPLEHSHHEEGQYDQVESGFEAETHKEAEDETHRSGSLSNDKSVGNFVPVFAGCCFSISGFNEDIRSRIKQLIVNNGGVYDGIMDRQKCTHLVIDTNTGEKFNTALQWGTIKIVRLEWLIRSSFKKVCLPEEEYFPCQKTSSQKENNQAWNDTDASDLLSPSRDRQR